MSWFKRKPKRCMCCQSHSVMYSEMPLYLCLKHSKQLKKMVKKKFKWAFLPRTKEEKGE